VGRTVIVYLTSICLLALPVKPHRSAMSFSMAPLGSFAWMYTIERGKLKDVSELPANAMLVFSPEPTSAFVEGYQAFALRKGFISGEAIVRSEWRTDLIFSKPAVKKLGFLTLRKGSDEVRIEGVCYLLDGYLQVDGDLGCVRLDLFKDIIHRQTIREET
jgi:hypothetical protein